MRPTAVARGARWVVWMKYERFAVDHVNCSEYGPFFATAEASHFATATLVDFRPKRANKTLPVTTFQVEVTVAGPTAQQILKRPEYAWAMAVRTTTYKNMTDKEESSTPGHVLAGHATLEESGLYELVPWPHHARYDPDAAHALTDHVQEQTRQRPTYRLNIWSIGHRSFSPFVVGTHYKPIRFVVFPSQELRKVLTKMGFLKREESFVFAVSSGKGLPDAANGHVSIFHSFRWFNNKDSAVDIPPPPPSAGTGVAVDWKHALTTQSQAAEPTVTLLGTLPAPTTSGMGGSGSNARRPMGAAGLSATSIYASRMLRNVQPLAIEGTVSAGPAARNAPPPGSFGDKKTDAAAHHRDGTKPDAGASAAQASSPTSASATAPVKLTLPSTMPPSAFPPAIALAPVPKDPSMTVGGRSADDDASAQTAFAPNGLQTFTNVVNTSEEGKARGGAFCWWPF